MSITTYQEALKKASATIEQLLAENEGLKRKEPIVIIGMGCRLPGGANSPEEFWRLLSEGGDAISPIPADRWPAARYHSDDPEAPGKMYVGAGGFLDASPYGFDSRFFGISPKEARALDPQQRLLLEVAWESLEDAGINPASLQGSRTGVFVGISSNDYDSAHLRSGDLSLIDPYTLTGFTFSTAAGRISYTLGLEGPNFPIDTACSSSLVALHLACRSLRAGECDLALVGGVNLMLTPEPLIAFCKLRALSPDGRCKSFDAGADGYGRGEGAGMLVLKRMESAQRDRDRILAVVKASALNNDGRSNGLTAPNGMAQRRVIAAALEDGGLQPADLDYLEAHGTGTPLGDPIELEAIAAAAGPGRDATNPLLIGSVKTNIGHLEAAAGVAGIVKLVLALNHEKMPRHLHFKTPNPHVDWDRLPLRVASEGAPWPRSGRPRLAGISGFGFSGTNAHVILEEAPLPESAGLDDRRSCHLLLLSAADQPALRALAGRFADYLGSPDLPPLAAVCHTAAVGRNRFPHGLAVAGATPQELAQRLSSYQTEGTAAGLHLRSPQTTEKRGPVFLFTGQGSQYPGMGEELHRTSPVYREALERCDALFAPLLGLSILEIMHAGSEEQLARTVYTQPAIFSLEYALARLWLSWGVVPSAVLGHSIGELVAACIGGVLSLEDAATLVAHRGRLMNALPAGGVMAAVLCPEAQALPAIAPHAGRVSVAAVNSPGTVVISGEKAGVDAVLAALKEQGVSSQQLSVSHAFHSHLMDPALDEFERIAAGLIFHEPAIPVISNLTGRPASGDDLRTADYWRRHLRGAVRFGASAAYLKQQGHDLFLEIGATATLCSFVRQTPGEARSSASLKRGASCWSTLCAALGELHAAGVGIDWRGFDAPYRAGRVSIPTYRFQRERHVMDPVRQTAGKQASAGPSAEGQCHPLLGVRLDSPSSEVRFAGSVSTQDDSWLAGHVIAGSVIMLAAGYVEMALAAALREAPAGSPGLLEQVQVSAPLVLTAEPTRMQTVYRPETGSVEIFSCGGDRQWQLHAGMRARALAAAEFVFPEPTPGEETTWDGATYYADLQKRGFRYDGVLRSIKRLTLQGDHASGIVEAPPEELGQFVLHPALLDGCLTMAGAAFLYGADPLPQSLILVPAAVESLLFSGAPAASLQVRCIQRERNRAGARYDVLAVDAKGAAVFQLTGLTLRCIRKEMLAPGDANALAGLMYGVAWRERPLPAPDAPPAGRWLLLTDRTPRAQAVCGALKGAGLEVMELAAAEPRGADERGAEPGAAAALAPFSQADTEACALALRDKERPVTGILSLWGDDLAGNLRLVRWLLAERLFLPLRLATAGVHDPLGMEREIRPQGAALWGFGATLAAEIPELSCKLLDLSPWPGKEECAQLVRELSAQDGEDRVVLREGRRFLPRLCRTRPQRHAGPKLPEGDGFHLDVEERGSLDGICFRSPGRRAPAQGELEVQIRAVGLNFRDVLNVLGRYPGDPGVPGIECSGVVSCVGPGVDGLAAGDTVLIFNTDGCIADYLTVSAAHIVKIPEMRSFEAAAAVPVAFLTAWYGLHHLAGVARGDRVLIHAAAGGVGLAAVQICRAAGAQVFATAGSPEKRDLLQRMGVLQVMDSRSLAFAEQVMAATEGRGVDVVLNSLAGEFIDCSLALLAAGGRFIEIGKADARSDLEIGALHPSIAYRRFDLAAIAARQPALVSGMFNTIFPLFEQGALQPLPMTVFPVQRATDAFRFMAQSRHIGKVVISLADRHRERRIAQRGVVDPDAAYLITGGLGALGLAVADWLAGEGCRHLALIGRREPTEQAAAAVEALRAAGVQVAVLAADVALEADVQRAMAELSAGMPPLRGIFHAAGLTDDAMLADLDAERLERVLRPKLAGAWNLHRATERLDLDLFVLFSSLTAVTGSPGQANYAAANAALDGFARWRRSRGLAAVAIEWGPWAEAGMAAREGKGDRLAARGIRSFSMETGLQALAALLKESPAERCVADLDLQRLASFLPAAGGGLYAELFSEEGETAGDRIEASGRLQQLKEAAKAERPALMLLLIRELAARVMGESDPARIESDHPLQEQGFDSLMAVDLRNLIVKTFGIDLPVTLLFDYPTPEKIGAFLLDEALCRDGAWEAEQGRAAVAVAAAVGVVGAVAVAVEPGNPSDLSDRSDLSADGLVDEIERLLGM